MEKILKEAEEELKIAEQDMEKLSHGHKVELLKHTTQVDKLNLLLVDRDKEIGRLQLSNDVVPNNLSVCLFNHVLCQSGGL